MTMLIGASPAEVAPIVFVDIAIIAVMARLVGALFKRIGQPAVVGEIIAGIALGPSLLGAFPGHLPDRIFPHEARPFLSVVAQLGLVVFMFIVGLELDLGLIRGKERVAAVVSATSVVIPFGLGLLLALALHGSHSTPGAPSDRFVPFALFMGASMSVTAFPVLARILTERGMYRTPVGALTLACAAVDDILAWSLLAVVLAVVKSSGSLDLPKILLESAAYVAVMFVFVRPWLAALGRRRQRLGRLTPDMMAIVLAGLLVSSWVTARIGIHAIFGAFLFGVVMPRGDGATLANDILERLESMTVLLLLPVFFITAGLDADVRHIGLRGLGQLALIVLVAVAGKFIGASVAARAQGVPARQAAVIGTLMNTRGLTELVILEVGLSFGVLDSELFTLLVVMAVVTTVMTEPLLRLFYPPAQLARDKASIEAASVGAPSAYRVVVSVGNLVNATRLVDLALDLIGDEQPAELVLTRFVPLPGGAEVRSGLTAEHADQASSAEALAVLGRRADARGVPVVVRSQLSRDFAADLVAQAAGVQANVLILGWFGEGASQFDRDAFGRKVLREAPCDVLVLSDPGFEGVTVGPSRPILVTMGEGFHNIAALEMAVRVARSRQAEVRLIDVAPADHDRKVAASRRLAELAELVQRAGASATPCLADDGVTAEIVRQAPTAGAVAAGIDEEWYAAGRFGPGTDELLAAVEVPVMVVRGQHGITRRGIGGLVERIQGRGREDEVETQARLAAAGPQPTHPAT